MTIIIFILIYVIGFILAYGRARSSYDEFIYYNSLKIKSYVMIYLISLFSWLGFIAGFVVYFTSRECFELKFFKFKL